MQDTTNAPRALALLALGVTLAHLVLLQALPGAPAPPDKSSTRAFTTRTIVLRPPPVAADVPAPPAAPVAAARPKPPRPRPNRPTPVPRAAEPAAPAITATEAPLTVEPDAPPAVAQATPAQASSAAPAAELPAPAAAPETPAASLALAIPGSVRLSYALTGEAKQQTYHALGELLWLQDGETYDARLELSAFFIGSRVRTSTGTITGRGLAPQRFSDKWRKRELAAHFERDKGIVSFSANTPTAPLLPDAQDQLSVLLQVASMVAGDPARYPAGTSLTLPVIGPRDADTWSFTLHGEERIALPIGETPAVKLTRNPRREFDQKVEAWLAPGMSYLPVRLRITQPNGDFVDQQLRSSSAP